MKPSFEERARGCLLAGAAGDALGAPVEFMDHHAIRRQFGSEGIRSYAPAYGGIGKITDDTQMTLFTAEGMLTAVAMERRGVPADRQRAVRHAYLRWLWTQDGKPQGAVDRAGWLIEQKALFSRRAPGNTCLTALRNRGGEQNDSKGCGGIMRVAPCGIFYAGNPREAFSAGLEAAKLTHGHPTGYLAAGAFSAIIAEIMAGKTLPDATRSAQHILIEFPGHQETLHALEQAEQLARNGEVAHRAIPRLGQGWIAEEALAIALFCALSAPNLEEGIVNAVNITGDSDSTGAIAGNLLGAMLGAPAIPARWLDPLELRDVIETTAMDLVRAHDCRSGDHDTSWMCRYIPERLPSSLS